MPTEQSKPIAIVGSSCRLPGNVSSPTEFWELLCRPRDLSQVVPGDRFEADAFYDLNPEHHGTSNVKTAYFLQQDPARFDASFFNINPREAEAIDPQQRILLELVYEAMESAGYSLESLRGTKTGVFAGLMSTDYCDIQARDVMSLSQYHATGTARSILSNRISHFYDFRGPSITIDTACSSSLVAVHLAVQALRNRECNVAIVAGVNLILGPEMFMATSNLHMLSPDGKCKMWDSKANGYARAEGGGVLLLRTLEDVMHSQVPNTIQSIIRETGVNSDGRTPGITMPSSTSQVDLMRATFERAGLDPTISDEQCQYFEAHGTGTQAGDAAESKAIYNVFCEPNEGIRDHDLPHGTNSMVPQILVGSVKPMLGHSEGAAGVVGLLKTSLALRHAMIPPNLPIQHLSDKVPYYADHLKIPHELQQWPVTKTRRACVNSFGFGGTNAHVIVESYDDEYKNTSTTIRDEAIVGPFVFSAASQHSLVKMMLSYREHLSAHPHINLADLSWTLVQHRSNLPVRAAVEATDIPGLIEALGKETQSAPTPDSSSLSSTSIPQKGLLGVFTGQGAQWPSMGRSLFFRSRRFASTMRELDAYLQELTSPPSWSLIIELLKPASNSRVHIAEFSQPLCTALQIALLDVLFTTGVRFDAVVGHSSGEIAAVSDLLPPIFFVC
jgi:acyl transferase domain-containing protein